MLEERWSCPPSLWMLGPRERHPSHDLSFHQPFSTRTRHVEMAMRSVAPAARLVDAQRGEEQEGRCWKGGLRKSIAREIVCVGECFDVIHAVGIKHLPLSLSSIVQLQ